ncbi:PleD family two-component system response regulator [Phaeovulum sp.]|uniref:response regulator n=1 Tax=Phaeovulum sp. TaxID=2934796 RepID=UPI003563A406
MKILAVDDDPMFRKLLQTLLSSIGMNNLTLATSAVEAAQIIVDAKPPLDCFFIDMNLPVIKGDYLCRWIRHLPDYHDKTVMMITAKTDKVDIDHAFAAGASDYLTKPLDIGEFTNRVKQIEQHWQRAEQFSGTDRPKPVETADSQKPAFAAFAQPMTLDSVPGAIDLAALEKYLVQLSKSQQQEMYVIAFKIFEAAKLHLTCSADEYHRIMAAVATAILQNLKALRPFISYTGYGAFVSVAQYGKPGEPDVARLESAIGRSLRGMQIRQDDGTPIKIKLCISPCRIPGHWSGDKVLDAMYHTIVDAEARCGSDQ